MITSRQLEVALEKHIHLMKEQLAAFREGADLKDVSTEALMHADNIQGFLVKFQEQEEAASPATAKFEKLKAEHTHLFDKLGGSQK